MTYADEWKAISSRIRGLMQAGKLTRGELVNTNAAFLAAGLTDAWVDVSAEDAIFSDEDRIRADP